jgi:hypothetical protein
MSFDPVARKVVESHAGLPANKHQCLDHFHQAPRFS